MLDLADTAIPLVVGKHSKIIAETRVILDTLTWHAETDIHIIHMYTFKRSPGMQNSRPGSLHILIPEPFHAHLPSASATVSIHSNMVFKNHIILTG